MRKSLCDLRRFGWCDDFFFVSWLALILFLFCFILFIVRCHILCIATRSADLYNNYYWYCIESNAKKKYLRHLTQIRSHSFNSMIHGQWPHWNDKKKKKKTATKKINAKKLLGPKQMNYRIVVLTVQKCLINFWLTYFLSISLCELCIIFINWCIFVVCLSCDKSNRNFPCETKPKTTIKWRISSPHKSILMNSI